MSKRPRQIGITGGIGVGKSTICQIFKILKIPVYNADQRAKWLMNNKESLRKDIIHTFSTKAYSQGKLDRQYLAECIFDHQEQLNLLNSIVHPQVQDDYHQWVINHQKATYLIKEAALMFETGSHRDMDKTIVVTAPEQLRIERVLKRDPTRNKQQVKAIIDKQIAVENAIEQADYTIINNEKSLLLPKILALHQQFFSNK